MPAFNVYGAADLTSLVQAYRDAEAHILRLIAQALDKGAKGTSDYYMAQYGELHKLRREADKALTQALGKTNKELAGLLAANAQGAAAEAIPGIMIPAINTEAVNALTLQTTASLATMKNQVLRSVDDVFRAVTRVVSTRGIMTGESMKDRLQAALNEYAAKGLTAYRDGAGRTWKIDSYAEMALRTATNRAQNQGRVEQFEAYGIGLVRTSQHIGCSDLCLPYQGKILSLDGRTGTVAEVDPATGNNVTVTITATMDNAIQNGYHHPNCRHTDTAYIPGSPEPTPVETDEAEAAAEQLQRYHERQIRAWKRREAVAVTPQEQAKAAAKIKHWQARQATHLKTNPWLARRYDREQIRVGIAQHATGLPSMPKLNPAAASLAAPRVPPTSQLAPPATILALAGLERATARQHLHATYSPHANKRGLPAQAENWVRQYSGSSYKSINQAEREHHGKKPWDKEAIEHIDEAILKTPPLAEWVEVVRRVESKELTGSTNDRSFNVENIDTWEGKEFKSWGYLSTSTHGVSGFGQIELRLALPPGTRGIYIGWDRDEKHSISHYPHEEEYLLGRQTRYTVYKVEIIDGIKVAFARVTGQDAYEV